MSSNYFHDKVVLVTGASRGIGRALAITFAKKGAQVILNYNKSKKEAHDLAVRLKSEGYCIELCEADVSKGDEVEKLIDRIVARYNRIDILVNNAGIRRDGLLAMMSEEDWKRVIDVNLNSMYHT